MPSENQLFKEIFSTKKAHPKISLTKRDIGQIEAQGLLLQYPSFSCMIVTSAYTGHFSLEDMAVFH